MTDRSTRPPWHVSGQTVMLGQNGSPKRLPNPKRATRLVGDGPCVGSTSFALDRQSYCWDNNGFYRRLGLEPGAPRIEVARSFMDLDGHRSSLLTNAATVLLNRSSKRFYDALSFGVLWPDDEALIESLLSGDLEMAEAPTWSFYVDSLPDTAIERAQLGTWRWMISYLLWRSDSPVKNFAMGVSHHPYAAVVGFRFVAFVPVLDSQPSWEYSSAVAQALQQVAGNDTNMKPSIQHPQKDR